MDEYNSIVRIIRQHYPTVQAIYLFGSFGSTDEWPTSDVGIPVSNADSFRLLFTEKVIDRSLADRMITMVGFRNTVIHQYTKMDMQIVENVINVGWNDLVVFADMIWRYVESEQMTQINRANAAA